MTGTRKKYSYLEKNIIFSKRSIEPCARTRTPGPGSLNLQILVDHYVVQIDIYEICLNYPQGVEKAILKEMLTVIHV